MIEPVLFPKAIREKLEAPFPDDQVQCDGRGYSSIAWHHIAQRLTDVLGMSWNYKVIDITPHQGVWVVTAEICVQLADSLKVGRQGVGAANFDGNAADDVKSAASDALKRAAVLFGVSAYLYRQPKGQSQPAAPSPAPQPPAPPVTGASAQAFQVDAVRIFFKAYNMPDDWVLTQALHIPAWPGLPAATAASILSGQHPVCAWLKQQYPNVTPPTLTGGLKATNA